MTRAQIIGLALLTTITLGVAEDEESIEAQRQAALKTWGTDKLPKPADVDALAKSILGKPLGEQNLSDLAELADKANRVANCIGFIQEEYASYYRDNYRYDFVREKVAPYHDAYVKLTNRFRGYRNKAYYNLGLKHKKAGNEVQAFFYFRDALRLSSFTESDGDHKGIRYQAENQMKELLGLKGVKTFVYWK